MLGKGWTLQDAKDMFSNLKVCEWGNPLVCPCPPPPTPIGNIYHVYGLQPSSKNGLIRLPKVAEERHDKSEPDY